MADLLEPRVVVPGRVSIITATYNAAALLPRCLESVLSQDYSDIEHILIDGGSKDGTIEILKQYSDKIAYWITEKDKGVYDAWNKGVQRATGEWIAFLGADDQYVQGAVSSYMEFARDRDVDYVSSLVRWVPDPPRKPIVIGAPWRWPAFQREMRPAHVGSLHRHSLFQRYGLYDVSYRMVGDYELLLRPKENLRTAFMPEITAIMQAGGTTDGFSALTETVRAKIETGGRNRFLCHLELWIKYAKLAVRRIQAKLPDRTTH